jgi:hypothetical protein
VENAAGSFIRFAIRISPAVPREGERNGSVKQKKPGIFRAFLISKGLGRFTSRAEEYRFAVPGKPPTRVSPRKNSPPDCFSSPSCVFAVLQVLGRRPSPRKLLKKLEQNF